MTIDEAKKAGFRTAWDESTEFEWFFVWTLTGGGCHYVAKPPRCIDSNDFPTRAKARDELKHRKAEASAKRVEARVAARKAAGTQVPPPKPSKPTTVRGWLETIPDPAIREAAIRQCKEFGRECDNLCEAICFMKDWEQTEEGTRFWLSCFDAARAVKPWPSYPTKATKPVEHKLPEIPSWAPPLPEGYVPLGFAGAFKTTEKLFMGLMSSEYYKPWGYPFLLNGNEPKTFYAAPRDSEIVRLNFPWLAEEETTTSSVTGPKDSRAGNKYHRTIHGVAGDSLVVDVYNVLDAFEVTCPACQHAIKKLLCAGLRNKGSRLQDLSEAVESASRAVTLEKQRS